MGFDIAEIIVTKVHAKLVKAIITTTFGIILPKLDPLGTLATRMGPSKDARENLSNARNCLKRIDRCLNYEGAEVKAYYTALRKRTQSIIEDCQREIDANSSQIENRNAAANIATNSADASSAVTTAPVTPTDATPQDNQSHVQEPASKKAKPAISPTAIAMDITDDTNATKLANKSMTDWAEESDFRDLPHRNNANVHAQIEK